MTPPKHLRTDSPEPEVQAPAVPIIVEEAAPSSRGFWWKYAGTVLIGVSILALMLHLMGTRFDTLALNPPRLDEAGEARQEAAALANDLDRQLTAASDRAGSGSAASGSTGSGSTGSGSAASGSTTSGSAASPASASQLEATLALWAREISTDLGGVWVPWPSGAPSGYSNVPVPTVLASTTDRADLARAYTQMAAQLRSVPTESAPQKARLAIDAMKADDAALLLKGSLSCGEVSTADLVRYFVNPEGQRTLGAMRQWWETSIARTPADQRGPAESRQKMLDELSEASIMAKNGAKGDGREVFTPPPRGNVLGPDGQPARELNYLSPDDLRLASIALMRSYIDTQAETLNQKGLTDLGRFMCRLSMNPQQLMDSWQVRLH